MQPLRAYDSEEIAVIDNVGLLDIENRIKHVISPHRSISVISRHIYRLTLMNGVVR
jgi:hypothetical protein